MNLALLIGHFPPGSFGGAELQAESWARRLADRHRVTVITRRDPPSQPAREERDGFTVVRLPVARLPLLRTLLDLAAIRRAVAGLSPRPDLLLCFQTFVSGLAGVRIQAALGIPAVVWIRGEAEYRLGSGVHRGVSPRVWGRARGILVQTEENRRELLHELERRAPALSLSVAAKIEVVPNGLDLPEPSTTRGARVLTVGRLIRDKGVDSVIDAVAGLRGLLTVVGDGPERGRLEAQAAHHGLDARFEGFVSRERLAALYRECSCLVLAARRGEGLPNVVLEAMGHGRPVVATAVAGTRDLIVDQVNGLLVPPDDPRSLVAALARLSNERGLADRLGVAGRETAAKFTWERVRPRLEAALERWRAG